MALLPNNPNNREGKTMAHTKDLVLAEETTALQVFTAAGGLDPIVQEAVDHVAGFKHDLSTGAGRKRTASLAAKVAKLKVRLDDMGKEVIADAKAKVKLVDSSRKAMRDELDDLKIEARKPLTDWEEEAERIKEEAVKRLAAERLATEIEAGHEMALLMNEKVDREAEEAAAEAERQRLAEADRVAQDQAEREERLKREAAEGARIEAEQKAKAERDRIEQERLGALRREQEANERVMQAERDKVAAEQRANDQAAEAERQRIAAEERAKAQEQESILAVARAKEEAQLEAERAETRRKESEERARQQEIQRQQDEKDRIQREQEQREADTKHKGAINRQAVAELMEWAGLTEDQAKATVKAMANRKISSVTINY
jgi:hypothetical protein